MPSPLIYLALCWIIFCVLHSVLISLPLAAWLGRLRPGWEHYERLVYNAVALITLIPPICFSFTLSGDPLFSWDGSLRLVQLGLGVSAVFLFIGGSRQYDTSRFMGFRQLREKTGDEPLTGIDQFATDGVLKLIRHPWYSGGMMIVWARDLSSPVLVTNLIISLYFVVGAVLEERRMVQKLGAVYERYQRQVPMFFPWRWVWQKVKGS